MSLTTLPRTDPQWLDQLAHDIAQFGIGCREHAVRQLVDVVRSTRHLHAGDAVVLDVLADTQQPTVARERAYGLVHRIALSTALATTRRAA